MSLSVFVCLSLSLSLCVFVFGNAFVCVFAADVLTYLLLSITQLTSLCSCLLTHVLTFISYLRSCLLPTTYYVSLSHLIVKTKSKSIILRST